MQYRIGLVWEEAQIVVERLNGLEVTRSVLMQLALGGLLSEKLGKEFNKIVKKMGEDGQ